MTGAVTAGWCSSQASATSLAAHRARRRSPRRPTPRGGANDSPSRSTVDPGLAGCCGGPVVVQRHDLPQDVDKALQSEVLSQLAAFWDERDVRHLHHPVWFRQFGEAALVVRDEAGSLTGCLLGSRTSDGGYVHVVATLATVRGRGVGRALYGRFAAEVSASGRTMPTNAGSVAFHR